MTEGGRNRERDTEILFNKAIAPFEGQRERERCRQGQTERGSELNPRSWIIVPRTANLIRCRERCANEPEPDDTGPTSVGTDCLLCPPCDRPA